MTDWGLLAIQSVGVLILTFWACWDSRKRGYTAGREDGFRAGYAVGKLDGHQQAEGHKARKAVERL